MKRNAVGDLAAPKLGKAVAFAKQRRSPRGRPPLDDPPIVFAVRIHDHVVKAARKAARKSKQGIGPWVEAALLAALEE